MAIDQRRKNWQIRQLTNLLKHTKIRSKFWRERLPSRRQSWQPEIFANSKRSEIATQVKIEGSLVASDGNATVSSYASTGSTGTPVKVYVCPENGYYNVIRTFAQYFIDDLSLEENWVKLTRQQV